MSERHEGSDTRPRVLIFDFDGTLIDTAPTVYRSLTQALHEEGFMAPASIDELFSYGATAAEATGAIIGQPPDAPAVQAVCARYWRHYRARTVCPQLLPGVPEMLVALLQIPNSTLFIASATRTPFLHRMLKTLNMADFFTGIVGLEEEGESKEVLLARILQLFPVPRPEPMAYVGDRGFDMKAARSMGMLGYAVTWGWGTPQELRDAEPDKVFSHPQQLSAWMHGY